MLKLVLILLLAVHHPHVKPGQSISMIRQNQEIDRLQLPRIVDDEQLRQLESTGELERIPQNGLIKVASHVRPDRAFVRPWTKAFILVFARVFNNTFNTPLIINSAVRTMEQQRLLRRTNRFAIDERLSSHTTGITVDLARRGYTRSQQRWIKNYLTDMRDKGFIEFATEPGCWHVAVFSSYLETVR